eukprot:831421-Alexandrium_andersonii.AAC.1
MIQIARLGRKFGSHSRRHLKCKNGSWKSSIDIVAGFTANGQKKCRKLGRQQAWRASTDFR